MDEVVNSMNFRNLEDILSHSIYEAESGNKPISDGQIYAMSNFKLKGILANLDKFHQKMSTKVRRGKMSYTLKDILDELHDVISKGLKEMESNLKS